MTTQPVCWETFANHINTAIKGRISKHFCAADSDITFESCDRVLFKVHRKNLECTSEGFAPPDGTSSSVEVVPLAESAAVLELLFQFMYPQRQPDLKEIDFTTLSDFAEAVEKYSAMQICNIRMEAAYTKHPFEVLLYATKHGYPDLMDVCELRAIELSPTEAFGCFSPAVYIAWTRYYAQWLDILKYAHEFKNPAGIEPVSSHDVHHVRAWLEMLHRLGGSPASLKNLNHVFEPVNDRIKQCGYCWKIHNDWRSAMETKIAGLSKFSTFL